MQLVLTPELLLEAYKQGLFPMAYSGNSPYIHWVCPEQRGQLSIEGIHIPKSLLRTLKKAPFEIRVNTAFTAVMQKCAENTENRPETWINQPIIEIFNALHQRGHAHSLECWDNDRLVGGIYGLAVGRVFCGESMFSRARDASKVALIHLTARLWCGGFKVFDTQFVNDHLKQFGAYEISHNEYRALLDELSESPAHFASDGLAQSDILAGYLLMRQKR